MNIKITNTATCFCRGGQPLKSFVSIFYLQSSNKWSTRRKVTRQGKVSSVLFYQTINQSIWRIFLNYRGLSGVIIMTCLSSPIILFIVPGSSSLSYLHSYPSSGLDNSGPQRNQLFVNGVFHVECSGLNDFSTRWCFCNNVSTTRISAHLMIYPGFVGYFSPELRRWLWLGNDKVWVAGLPEISFPLIFQVFSKLFCDRFEKNASKKL